MELFDKLESLDKAAHVVADCHFLNALIGAGLSLASGLMGRADAKKRDRAAAEAAKVPVVTSHKLDLKGMNQAAIEAGYNPMTILQAGGMSAFTTTSTTGQNAMAAVPTAPSVGSVFAGAAMSAFDIYRDDQKTAAAAATYFPPAPVQGTPFSGAVVRGGAFSSGGFAGGAKTVANPYGYEQKQASQTKSMPWLLDTDTKFADTEAIETEYGEPISWVYGVGKLWANTLKTATGMSSDERAAMFTRGFDKAGSLAVDAVDYVDKWLDGSAAGTTGKPGGKVDQFNDPFPAWQW